MLITQVLLGSETEVRLLMSSPLIVASTSRKYVQFLNGSPSSQRPSSHLGQLSNPVPPSSEQLSNVTELKALNSISKVLFSPGEFLKPVFTKVPLKEILSICPSSSSSVINA